MPPKKNKSKGQNFLKLFVALMVIMTIGLISYIGYLWWQSRQFSMVTYPEFGIPVPSNYAIHGIDVSRYQSRIAWKAVKEMEVEHIKLGFAFIKATEGSTRVDPFFKRNWQKSRQADIIRGAYHFYIATKNPQEQADNFIKTVTMESGDLPPVLDVEQTFGVNDVQLRKGLKLWLNELEEHYGVKPIIYTNADFYTRHLLGHFDEYPLWVAHYLQPHQPRISRDWSFWQHSEQGRVNGILSKVDFNVFNGDSIAFKSLLLP